MDYHSVQRHRSMAPDDRRNAAYFEALRAVITPDSVVLDVGAGLGILGLMAAKLGARQVYLVEPSNVIEVASQIASKNGLAERVTTLRDKMEDVELDEPVDVILSVLTGNFLLQEDLLPVLFDARDRFLKPGGAMLPDCARMMVAPIEAPLLFGETVDQWSTPVHGIDLSTARCHAGRRRAVAGRACRARTARFPDGGRGIHGRYRFHHRGCIGAVPWPGGLVRHATGPELVIDPSEDHPPMHWATAYLPLDPPRHMEVGE